MHGKNASSCHIFICWRNSQSSTYFSTSLVASFVTWATPSDRRPQSTTPLIERFDFGSTFSSTDLTWRPLSRAKGVERLAGGELIATTMAGQLPYLPDP